MLTRDLHPARMTTDRSPSRSGPEQGWAFSPRAREGRQREPARRLRRWYPGAARAPFAGSWLLAALWLWATGAAAAPARGDANTWRIIIANDTCPDVTWGFTEEQTRQAFADLIAAHLDEMNRTDSGPSESRDHYNLSAFIEAEAFLERYPERQEEFVRRVREGRICVSPFLCNSLWGFQSVEGVLRAFYPARRFERMHGLVLDMAAHIELPSLPWGLATILAGCGVRWTSVPFLDYDCTFGRLRNPPLFRWVGPDGAEVRVLLDAWASRQANYSQGASLLKEPAWLEQEWLPHYAQLGAVYPLRVLFASGTHSDINPASARQARGFVEAISRYNAGANRPARLVNGTLAQFCQEVDVLERASPFLPVLRGCFGHSWELWPVSLAKTVAALRENERAFLAAESLVAIAAQAQPSLGAQTRAERERAEWYWAMLSDHAWNGTDLTNQRHNAGLRCRWAHGLGEISAHLTVLAWQALGLETGPGHVSVFNPLSFSRDVVVTCHLPAGARGVEADGRRIQAEVFLEGADRQIRFVAERLPAFGFRQFKLSEQPPMPMAPPFAAGSNTLEGPFYRLAVDPQNGGITSLVHKASSQELVMGGKGRSLCQTVFFDGKEQQLSAVDCRAQLGAVSGQLHVTGRIGEIRFTNIISLYATLDRVDFDVRIEKPPTAKEQRLLQFFPLADSAAELRIETPGAVLRPCPQPEGDLLPGADPRRFAVQGFIDFAPAGRVGVTVAPREAFLLRLDQGPPAFEPIGNDQNWKEVTPDQDGVRQFQFRYSLRVRPPGYDNAAALAWSRSATMPAVIVAGQLPKKWLDRVGLEVDPTRALVTCFKPVDGAPSGQALVRCWETRGAGGPVPLRVRGYLRARRTDLLEREREPLELHQGEVNLPLRPHGFGAVRLESAE